MRYLLLMLAALTQEGFAPSPRPIPDRTIPARPLIELDESAVATMAQAGRTPDRGPVLYVADVSKGDGRCIPCEQSQAVLGSAVTVKHWRESGRKLAGLPCLHLPDADQWFYGYTDPARLAGILAQYPAAPAASAPQLVGTINARTAIEAAILTSKAFGGNQQEITLTHAGRGWIEAGRAGVLIPNGCKATLTHESTASRITFSGAKPRVRLVAVDQPVNAVVYADGKLTVDWDGWLWPDAEMEVR